MGLCQLACCHNIIYNIIIIIINATYIVLSIRHVSIFGVLGGVLEHHQIEETQETVSKF